MKKYIVMIVYIFVMVCCLLYCNWTYDIIVNTIVQTVLLSITMYSIIIWHFKFACGYLFIQKKTFHDMIFMSTKIILGRRLTPIKDMIMRTLFLEENNVEKCEYFFKIIKIIILLLLFQEETSVLCAILFPKSLMNTKTKK